MDPKNGLHVSECAIYGTSEIGDRWQSGHLPAKKRAVLGFFWGLGRGLVLFGPLVGCYIWCQIHEPKAYHKPHAGYAGQEPAVVVFIAVEGWCGQSSLARDAMLLAAEVLLTLVPPRSPSDISSLQPFPAKRLMVQSRCLSCSANMVGPRANQHNFTIWGLHGVYQWAVGLPRETMLPSSEIHMVRRKPLKLKRFHFAHWLRRFHNLSQT